MKWIDGEPQIIEVDVKPEYIKEVAENYDSEWQQAPFMVGHRDYEQPALAWIAELKAEGKKLFAKLTDITPRLTEIIANKEYKYVSIGTDIYTRDGRDFRYLGHLAATNFPLILGLQKLPDAFTGIAASRSIDSVVTQKIDFKNFSEGISASAAPETLNDSSMNEKIKLLATHLGIRISDYPTDDAVLVRASEIIKELISKFPAGTEQPSSLEMCVVSCGKLVAENSTLNTQLTAAKSDAEKATTKLTEIIIASAIESGKILEAEKPTYEKLLKDSPEATVELLASKKPSGIFEQNKIQAARNGKPEEGVKAGRENWTYRDWETKDSEGLKAMMNSDREKFDKLFASQYPGAPVQA